VPVLVAVLIVAFPLWLGPLAKNVLPFPLAISFAEVIFIVGVPMFMGLLWNKFAGGISGFLLGSIYYLATAGYQYVFNLHEYGSGTYNPPSGTFPGYWAGMAYDVDGTLLYTNMWGDITIIAFIIVAMLIGYVAGALNGKSTSFKRMLGASMTAGLTGGVFAFLVKTTSPMVTDYPYVAFITLLPMIIFAVIVPIIAKVFTWYGIQPLKH